MHGTSILAYNDILEEKERRPSYVGSITDSNLTLKSGDLLTTFQLSISIPSRALSEISLSHVLLGKLETFF